MKVAVLLHGSGVYDGTEIQEATFTLLALAQNGHTYQCIAPDIKQYHVVNHATGEETDEVRNGFVESARISRRDLKKVKDISVSDFDALVMPGGFGTAKNFTTWAFNGPQGEIVPEIKNLILGFIKTQKPIVGLCMSPTTIAKALQNTGYQAKLTVGTSAEKSPYEIGAISEGIKSTGAVAEMKSVREITIDKQLKIITAPCYMMNATIVEVYQNIVQAIQELDNI